MHTQKTKHSDSSPRIPEHLLGDFLEEKIGISNLKNLVKIKSNYLWNRENVERYRINVYIETKQNEEDYYHKNSIGYSFFIHYDRDEEIILDKTGR